MRQWTTTAMAQWWKPLWGRWQTTWNNLQMLWMPEHALQALPIEGNYYRRSGSCHQCGSCCENIYLVHAGKPIPNHQAFYRLQGKNPDYQSFVPMEQSEQEIQQIGVKFRCENLQEDRSCSIYDNRPSFCRRYPTEEILLAGGKMAENCGYRFELKHTFSEVLEKKQSSKK